MSKLKICEDLQERRGEIFYKLISFERLKKEAIKWVKQDDFKPFFEWLRLKFSQDHINNFSQEVIMAFWIKYFFSIEEKDLK